MNRFALPLALLVTYAGPAAADTPKNRPLSDASTRVEPTVAVTPPPLVQNYEPKPAMWKLSDADTTIYLFGTSHMLPPGLRWRTPAFDRVVIEANELIVETSDAEADEQLKGLQSEMSALVARTAPTSTRLSPANAAKWRRVAAGTDIPFTVFDRMPVLMAMMGAGLSLLEQQGWDHESGVETILEAEFAKAAKPVGSIENSATVMRALLGIDDSALVAQLEKDLSAWDGKDSRSLFDWGSEDGDGDAADPFADDHSWARGELAEMFSDEELKEPAVKALHDVLLRDRNRAWADWLKHKLERPGKILVAVGAAHLAGDVSVQAMLAQRGLAVERVQ